MMRDNVKILSNAIAYLTSYQEGHK
jgi:hypothetical protein